jgi:FtsZ-interacting cell division protein ZipA
MNTITRILGGVAIAALLVGAFASVESSASTPSSPAERAATAELNRDIMLKNAVADEHHKMLEAQYQEQKRQYEAQQQQYQAKLQSPQDNLDR